MSISTLFNYNGSYTSRSSASSSSQQSTTIRRVANVTRGFVRTFAIAASATGIAVSLFIVVLEQIYQQHGARTVI
jgi:hypothetical protein